MMKSLSIIAVILACAISFIILFIDSRSEIGILNNLSMEKEENIIREESVDVTPSNEEQGEQPKDSKDAVKTEEPVAENEEVTNKEVIPPTSNTESFVIVIDPGHQAKANLEQEPIGPDARETKYKVTGGTTGVVTGKPEYVLTLEAANLLKAHLEKKGFQVILTRTSHDVDISNQERAEIANNMELICLYVSMQMDQKVLKRAVFRFSSLQRIIHTQRLFTKIVIVLHNSFSLTYQKKYRFIRTDLF